MGSRDNEAKRRRGNKFKKENETEIEARKKHYTQINTILTQTKERKTTPTQMDKIWT